MTKPSGSRLRAATLLFERPKFTAIAQLNKDDFAVVMERALEAMGEVIDLRPMQVLEAPKVVDAGETVQAERSDTQSLSVTTPNIGSEVYGKKRSPGAVWKGEHRGPGDIPHSGGPLS